MLTSELMLRESSISSQQYMRHKKLNLQNIWKIIQCYFFLMNNKTFIKTAT